MATPSEDWPTQWLTFPWLIPFALKVWRATPPPPGPSLTQASEVEDYFTLFIATASLPEEFFITTLFFLSPCHFTVNQTDSQLWNFLVLETHSPTQTAGPKRMKTGAYGGSQGWLRVRTCLKGTRPSTAEKPQSLTPPSCVGSDVQLPQSLLIDNVLNTGNELLNRRWIFKRPLK